MDTEAQSPATLAVSVVIPTLGRPELLRELLASLAACQPRAAEILVVDQSEDTATRQVVEELSLPWARVIDDRGRGRGRAVNRGLRQAVNDRVLITDDDCTVPPEWVAAGSAALDVDPEGIASGQVLPGGEDAALVPSLVAFSEPADYTGELRCGVLYAGNMACSRDAVLALGGFDEQIVPSAEDCDLCYRWLGAGRSLRRVPEMVVWHGDWRTPEQLERHYRGYQHGLGVFYAKHLRARDLRVLRFLFGDLYGWLRSLPGSASRGPDPRHRLPAGLAAGLRDGWRKFGPRARAQRGG